ncbi:hypothetical protein ICC18_15195 [Paenibacillus sp. WST5]|uniref:Uncharacterized protein n=1 Tax=Paenibacillus sedimenti TaxID=2770274 RepID=A0A926KQ76_9BACL|nr:hypothetical protein [Paenibacillus sedimenti]
MAARCESGKKYLPLKREAEITAKVAAAVAAVVYRSSGYSDFLVKIISA